MAKISVLGVDLGKNVRSVVGLDASGAAVMRRRMRRETLIALAEKLPACVVEMEACCGSHHLGRVFTEHGHDVRGARISVLAGRSDLRGRIRCSRLISRRSRQNPLQAGRAIRFQQPALSCSSMALRAAYRSGCAQAPILVMPTGGGGA